MSEHVDDDPFVTFRARRNLSEPHMRQAQVILAAVTDVIAPQTSPVAYMGALMTALQQLQQEQLQAGASAPAPESMSAMLYLLGMAFPALPLNVLKSKHDDISKVLLGMLEAGTNAEDAQIAKPVLSCLGTLLSAQDLQAFSQKSLVRAFQALLVFSVDPRPKVRKAAQSGAVAVTERAAGACYLASVGAAPVPFPKALADAARDFTLREFSRCTPRDSDVALHLLSGYLSSCLPVLPRTTCVAPIVHSVLALCRACSGHSILTLQTFKCLQAFFENAGPITLDSSSVQSAQEYEDNLKFIDTLLGSLLEQAPHPNESQACVAYFQTVAAALRRLGDSAAFDPHGVTSGRRLASFLSLLLSDYLQSSKFEVVEAAANTAAQLLRSCVHVKMAAHMQTASTLSSEPTPLDSILVTLQSLLTYRFKAIWSSALRVVHAGLDIIGKHASVIGVKKLAPILIALDQLLSGDDLVDDRAVRQLVEGVVGVAIEHMGPEMVLSVLPLRLPFSEASVVPSGSFDQQLLGSRTWLLGLMSERITAANLAYFWQHLHPVLNSLHTARTAAQQENAPIRARAILALMEQCWSTFPAFCRLPVDLQVSFKPIARQLGTYLSSVTHAYAWAPLCRGLTDLALACSPEVESDDEEDDDDENDRRSDSSDEGEAPAKPARQDTRSVKSGRSVTSVRSVAQSQRSAARIAAWNTKSVVLRYSDADAEKNAAVLGPFAKNFLPIFFNLVERVDVERRQMVLDAITAYAGVADAALLNSTFKNILKMLLQSAVGAGSDAQAASKVHVLADIAFALCDRLDTENLDWLYKTIRPQLIDADVRLQKKAYKTLARLCSSHPQFLAAHVEDLIVAFSESLGECAAGSKKARLRCLRTLVQRMPSLSDPRVMQSFPILLGEVLLGIKELSERSRAVAYDVLLSMADRMKQEHDDDMEDDSQEMTTTGVPSIKEFFMMVVGGLAGGSQHMKSGAVLALSRLLYEFSEELPVSFVLALVETVLLLLKEKSREVVKSVLGFCKVAMVTLPAEKLRPHLQLMIEGLLIWSKEAQSRFRQKTRVLLIILTRRFGAETVLPLVPEDLQKWLSSITKSERRAQKKKEADKAAKRSGAQPKGKANFEDLVHVRDQIDEDEEDELAGDTGSSIRRKAGSATGNAATAKGGAARDDRVWLRADDDEMDLLDPSMARHVTTSNPQRKKQLEAAAAARPSPFGTDDRGRMVVPKHVIEEMSDQERDDYESDGGDSDDGAVAVGKGKVIKTKRPAPVEQPSTQAFDVAATGRSEDDSRKPFYLSKKAQQRKDDKERIEKKRKTSQVDGSIYRSAKASGDMKVKGQADPYAFLPLDPAMLNRRNKHQADHQFDSFVKAAQKGSAQGTEARNKWKKSNKRH